MVQMKIKTSALLMEAGPKRCLLAGNRKLRDIVASG
jgi:hypothetical protein